VAALVALGAAVAFALAAVLQQRGTLEVPSGSDDPRFFARLVRRPVWLAGAALNVVGWILQAVALDLGPLMVVQTIVTLSLVIALPFGVWLTRQRVGRREALAALAAVAGISVFIVVGDPATGVATGTRGAWIAAGALVTALIAGLVFAQRTRRPGPAATAVVLGTAAGACFGFQAAATKVFVGVVPDGLAAILGSWSTYALIVSALVGFVLQQSALKTGVLASAMASTNVANMVVSVALGALVFEETLSHEDHRFAVSAAALAVALFAVVTLTRASAPEPRAAAA
jgi:drug/metabolite transporter (DMT)-like permease